MWVS